MTDFDPNIPNIAFYNDEMKKAMFDKLFFLDKIDADVIVDYGCADGTMIQMMKSLFPNKIYIGYDISAEMLNLALKKCHDLDNVFFYHDWQTLTDMLEFHFSGSKTAIVLSSLLHEVYSYCTKEEIKEIRDDRAFGGLFDYICIRDMHYKTGHSLNNMENLAKMFRTIPLEKIKEHEAEFGPVTGEKSFMHLLLKYRYEDNWKHEVKEDYFAFRMSDFTGGYVGSGQAFRPLYQEEFCPLFIQRKVEEDTGIDMKQSPTHIKLIFGKRPA